LAPTLIAYSNMDMKIHSNPAKIPLSATNVMGTEKYLLSLKIVIIITMKITPITVKIIPGIAKIVLKKYQEIMGKENKIELKFVKSRKGDVKRHCADITHSRKILGYKPLVKLEEGIERYIIWRQNF